MRRRKKKEIYLLNTNGNATHARTHVCMYVFVACIDWMIAKKNNPPQHTHTQQMQLKVCSVATILTYIHIE